MGRRWGGSGRPTVTYALTTLALAGLLTVGEGGSSAGGRSPERLGTVVLDDGQQAAAPSIASHDVADASGRDRTVLIAAPLETVTVISAGEALEEELVAIVLGLDGIVASAKVRSGTVGLFRSVDADGVGRDVLPAGYRIPVTVTALEPGRYVATLPDAPAGDVAILALLAPGTVLLSSSSAALRGIGAGGTVDVGGASGLAVVGVVNDRTARGSEFLAHGDDAAMIGLGSREALLVRHAVEHADAIVDVLAGVRQDVRVWRDEDRVPIVLSQVEVKARFGEFAFRLVPGQREVDVERAFIAENIVIERMPVIGNVRCHRAIMDDLRGAVEAIVDAGLEEWLAPRRFGGCFHPRRIGFGRENLSRHAWGIAIDLNVDFAVPGAGPVPPDAFIEIMGRHGFRWGGDFATPDNHHFEWVGDAALVRPERPPG